MIQVKWIVLIILILIGVFIYAFGLTRLVLFWLDRNIKKFNKKYFDFLFIVNRGIDHWTFRYALFILALYFLIISIYYMFRTL